MSVKVSHVATDTLVTHANTTSVTARPSLLTHRPWGPGGLLLVTENMRHRCLEDAF